MVNLREHQNIAAERSQIYWLLSRLVLEPPNVDFIAELASSEVDIPGASPVDQEFHRLATAAKLADGPAELERLQVDFTRLFLGVSDSYGPPPPLESLARNAPVEDTHAELSAAYEGSGLSNVAADVGALDHLGVELRFMSYLCVQESAAWERNDHAAASERQDGQADFLTRHVMSWLDEYCRRTESEATTQFYAAVLRLLSAACKADFENLKRLPA